MIKITGNCYLGDFYISDPNDQYNLEMKYSIDELKYSKAYIGLMWENRVTDVEKEIHNQGWKLIHDALEPEGEYYVGRARWVRHYNFVPHHTNN